MQLSGEELIEKKQTLITHKRILNNIEITISTLRHCLGILDKTNKINLQIENHKYYSALRVVEELQTVHLYHIIQYGFAQHMQECIPLMKEKIKVAVTKEMKTWLIKIRESSRKVGSLAMEQMSDKILKIRETSPLIINTKNNRLEVSSIDLAINEDYERKYEENYNRF